jgi:hypothetical protein
MIRDIGHGHQLTQFIDISGQARCHPQVRVKQLQILDMDAMAVSTKYFAIPAGNPGTGTGQVQIPNPALSPTVNTGCSPAAFLANGSKSFVGLRVNVGACCFGRNALSHNFDSTKGEI